MSILPIVVTGPFMLQVLYNPLIAGGISVIAAALLTLLVRGFARKFDFVAKPKSDRWHKRPTAMLGGVAIFVSTTAIYFLLVPITHASLVVIGGGAFLFLVGLLDDIHFATSSNFLHKN